MGCLRHWRDLGLNMPCPIHFTEDELRIHEVDGKDWNDVQDFWESISGLVQRDGWTSIDTYAEALNFFQDLRRNALDSMTGREREDFDIQTRWAENKSNL